ncbi:MAG TPA: hypothetical protein VHG52_10290, partial [Thermomicrobiales bacterium]|nr:hypothetical protein [Thermomicrobiales bacterium]
MYSNRKHHRRSYRRLTWLFAIFLLLGSVQLPPVAAYDTPKEPTPIKFLRKNTIFASPGDSPMTVVAYGPDGRVYAGTTLGMIYALTLDAARNVTAVEEIDAIYNTPNFNEDGTPMPNLEGRLLLGLTFDPQSTAAQPIMYASHSDPRHVYNSQDPSTHIDVNSGMITRLTGPNFDAPSSRVDVLTGLPRSRKNHGINGVNFGHDGWLYIATGGHTDTGTADPTWGSLPEFYLSAAILRADVRSMTSSLDVRHVTSATQINPLQDRFQIFATGFRNAYDLVWHSDGSLYVNENGANVYQGTTPGP